jgi:predicted nuclease of predicted toxin-antitoxin system
VRILLDECVHAGVRSAFPGHAVKTVTEAGWRSSKDGPLLAFAERHFEVFVTIDRKLERQHDLSNLRLGFVVARVVNNTLAAYLPVFVQLREAAERVRSGEVLHVAASKKGP